ncbi:hypothetical protein D3C87_2168100 [compost metagenome]
MAGRLQKHRRGNVHLHPLIEQNRAGIAADHIAQLGDGAFAHIVNFRNDESAHHSRNQLQRNRFM